jgi:hypothetical protein
MLSAINDAFSSLVDAALPPGGLELPQEYSVIN